MAELARNSWINSAIAGRGRARAAIGPARDARGQNG